MKQAYTEIDSPVGRILLAGEEGCLRALLFGEGPKRATPQEDWVADAVPFRRVIDQLNAYFAGELREFAVNLDPEGTYVPTAGLAGTLAYSVWGDDLVRTTRDAHRQPQSIPRRGIGEWVESDFDHRPLPSRDRLEWETDGLWRRPADQREAPRAGATPVVVPINLP